ncbi:MAG: aminodeoxychorismate synthase component I [Betaproteobacteria bacterium]|nr:aminodeoxychorismate synthase component I [Betaproteobacteria bacterium]
MSEAATPNPSAAIRAVVHDATRCEWLALSQPVRIFATSRPADVVALLADVDHAVANGEGIAAGWVSYEAATAFDAHLSVKPAGPVPLLWFGVFADAESVTLPDAFDEIVAQDWTADMDEAGHATAVRRVLDYIREGDTYQVNCTYRQHAPFHGDPWRVFQRLVAAQRESYGAFIDTGRHVVCSASPELYFRLDGERVVSKPMKGTAARGLTLAEDRDQARNLRASEKERAENLMIVDMVRNDFGRLADTGSVKVPQLFTVEKYPTLWTMTSTVEARTDASLSRIFAETFPPASITGAPKRRTMEIIAELERSPRGVYTGAVGFIAPNRIAQFNVAIRTLVVDRERREAEYGVGSGIVWDSVPAREWQECATKSRILKSPITPFELLETLKWTPEEGYVLLERHLSRLMDSAEYFDVPLHVATSQSPGDSGWTPKAVPKGSSNRPERLLDNIRKALADAAQGFGGTAQRVRLLVDYAANIRIEAKPLNLSDQPIMRVALAAQLIDSNNRFLYHKTTHRDHYDAARASRPGFDDVVLWNERGEVCETTIANLAIQIDGQWVTPPVSSGLLPGTLRAEMLARGELVERIVTVDELKSVANIRLFNSVRGVFEGTLSVT